MSNVLLFSSGMDSFCLLKSYHYDDIIFFYTGTKDNHRELLQIYNMIDDKIVPSDIHILSLPLGTWELPNKIVPHRNTIMCLIAANYGNNIYIGTTKGDTTKDKDYVFKSQVEGILNYFGQDSQKVFPVGYPYQIIMPFKNLTKTEILARYLEACNDISPLLQYSRSCYSGDDKECGTCRSCLRKAIALRNNNIDYRNVFKLDPLTLEWSPETILKMKSRPSEWQEYQRALNVQN